jgi:lysine-N-methylase
MSYFKRSVLQPEYMTKFTCIGGVCEDTCCKDWGIFMDKKIYKLYKKSKETVQGVPLRKSVRPLREDLNNKRTYGQLILKKDGKCPFLTEDNWCGIYKQLGEEYLGEVCKLYPRLYYMVENQVEKGGAMSCPEVGRLMLFNEEKMLFKKVEETLHTMEISTYFRDLPNIKGSHREYLSELRWFSINILQNRDYSLDERLILLGIAYKRLEVVSLEEIPETLKSLELLIKSGEFRESLVSIPSNHTLKIKFAKNSADERVSGTDRSKYLHSYAKMLLGLAITEEYSFENTLSLYQDHYKNIFEPYIKEKPYVLENYFVNLFFNARLPVGVHESLWDAYIHLCVVYSVAKLHLVGVAGYEKKMNDALIVETLYRFSRAMEHNEKFIKDIVQLVKDEELDSFAYMAILVKD